MNKLTIQIFSEDLSESFEHYKKAFNATLIATANGSHDELIHLEMDIFGNKIALAPHQRSNKANNTVVLCVKFQNKNDLMTAYNVLKENGQTDGLELLPWSPLEGYVTDKFGVMWCIGL